MKTSEQTFDQMKQIATEFQNWSVGLMSLPVPGGGTTLRFVAVLHRTHYSDPGFERRASGRVTVGFVAEADDLDALALQMKGIEAQRR